MKDFKNINASNAGYFKLINCDLLLKGSLNWSLLTWPFQSICISQWKASHPHTPEQYSHQKQGLCCSYFFVSGNFCQILLFLGMIMYANEVETKEKQKLLEIKN